jgi:hypothetical protein
LRVRGSGERGRGVSSERGRGVSGERGRGVRRLRTFLIASQSRLGVCFTSAADACAALSSPPPPSPHSNATL